MENNVIHIKELLGTHGVGRISEFLEYPDGWDDGGGDELNAESIETLELFIQHCVDDRAFPETPSVFLTRDGMLELQWEEDGGINELTCFPSYITVHHGAFDKWNSLDRDDFEAFGKSD